MNLGQKEETAEKKDGAASPLQSPIKLSFINDNTQINHFIVNNYR